MVNRENRPGPRKLEMTLRKAGAAVAISLGSGLGLVPAPSPAATIDCKVILCLAGGFPTGCADARSYMMRRITAQPPRPPFGTCETVSLQGTEEIYDAATGWLGVAEGASQCVATAPRTRDDDGGWCTRRCTDVLSNVYLAIALEGDAAPYRAQHTYARAERCENLNRDGQKVDEER